MNGHVFITLLIIFTQSCDGYFWQHSRKCRNIRTRANCENNRFCYWYQRRGTRECVAKLSCATYKREISCMTEPLCKWDNTRCKDRCLSSCVRSNGCRRTRGRCINRKLLGVWKADYCIGGTFDIGSASCDCSGKFGGSQCHRCPGGYDSGPTGTCSQCVGVNTGGVCSACNVTHCNNHASLARAGTISNPGCTCTCSPRYGGQTCNECAIGRVDYPICSLCNRNYCNRHSSAQTAMGNTCDCTCEVKFSGSRCERCAPTGFNYPSCTTCDAAYCSGRSTAAAVNPGQTACQCTCSPNFDGDRCERCATNYFGPNCDECSVANPCSNNAVSALPSINGASCMCTCKSNFEGPICDRCAPNYFGTACLACDNTYCNNNALAFNVVSSACTCTCKAEYTGPTCGECAVGYFNYPTCTRCDAAYCNNLSVPPPATDLARTSCQCSCPTIISGDRCEQCNTNRITYPTCTLCSTTTHCNSHANSVTAVNQPLSSQCVCDCSEGFGGANCDSCEPGYLMYPTCSPSCTAAIFCHGNAVSASNATSACVCSCKANFRGQRCEECIPGLINWPTCRACTVSQDCSNHASNVNAHSTDDSCVCQCNNQWNTANCSNCPLPFAGSSCDECADGYFGTPPTCTKCNITTHCNGRGNTVVVNPNNDGCDCDCTNQWQGISCETCPLRFEQQQCNTCVDGNPDFPACGTSAPATGIPSSLVPTLVPTVSPVEVTSCNRSRCDEEHTTEVTVTCDCICKQQFTGPTCDIDCGSSCLINSIRSTTSTDPCNCDCTEGWEGTNCDVCINGTICEIPKPKSLNPIDVFSAEGSLPKGLVSAPIGTTSGGRLKVISALCGAEDDILDPEIAPLRIKIGSSDHASYIGGILGNSIFILTPILVHFIAVLVRMRYMPPNERSFKIASADMRFPYLSLFFVIFMYHGMATCGLKLSVFGTASERAIGITSLLLYNIGFLILIGIQNRRLTGDASYYTKEDTTMLSRYFFGPGEWVSASKSRRVHRWGLLFEMYRPGFTWFLILECVILFIITIFQVIEASKMPECRNLAALLSALFGCLATIIFFFHPWASMFDNHGNSLILGLEAIACGFLARGFHTGDRSDWSFDQSSRMLVIVSYLTVMKGFIDPILLLYVEWNRRDAVQRDFYHAHDDQPHELTSFEKTMEEDYLEDSLVFYNHSNNYSPSDVSEGVTPIGSVLLAAKSSRTFSIKSPSCIGGPYTPNTASPLVINKPIRLKSYPLIEKWRNSSASSAIASLADDTDAAEILL